MSDKRWRGVFDIATAVLCFGGFGVTIWYLLTTPFMGRLVMPIAAALAGIAQVFYGLVLLRRGVRRLLGQ